MNNIENGYQYLVGNTKKVGSCSAVLHFSGSRYVSWLPSFSVEVTHTNMLANNRPVQTSQLDNMVRMKQSSVLRNLKCKSSIGFNFS